MLRGLSAAKAWVGAALAAGSAVSAALAEHHGLTWGDIVIVISAFVGGYQGVYWTSNEHGERAGNGNSSANRSSD